MVAAPSAQPERLKVLKGRALRMRPAIKRAGLHLGQARPRAGGLFVGPIRSDFSTAWPSAWQCSRPRWPKAWPWMAMIITA